MRVDNPEHGKHDHGFGTGAHGPEHHDVSLGGEQLGHEAGAGHELDTGHGLFDTIGHGAAEVGTASALGGHVEVGHLTHDFGHDGLHDGLDGLHDSVSHSLGLGFEGDDHHSLHEGLHESLHSGDESHDLSHGLGHDVAHDPAHDPQHHDTGLGDLFHH